MLVCRIETAQTWSQQCKIVRTNPDKMISKLKGKTFAECLMAAIGRVDRGLISSTH